jgi:hypothetical protein
VTSPPQEGGLRRILWETVAYMCAGLYYTQYAHAFVTSVHIPARIFKLSFEIGLYKCVIHHSCENSWKDYHYNRSKYGIYTTEMSAKNLDEKYTVPTTSAVSTDNPSSDPFLYTFQPLRDTLYHDFTDYISYVTSSDTGRGCYTGRNVDIYISLTFVGAILEPCP